MNAVTVTWDFPDSPLLGGSVEMSWTGTIVAADDFAVEVKNVHGQTARIPRCGIISPAELREVAAS
jgi:hypothetical protein